MSNKYYYSTVIENTYLGVSKELKAQSQYELTLKVWEQTRKWDEKEKRQREREKIQDLKEKAEFDTEEALEIIDSFKNILKDTLRVSDVLNWEDLKEKKHFKKFQFSEEFPTLEKIKKELGVPDEKRFVESIFKSKKELRLHKEAEAKSLLDKRIKKYEQRKAEARARYEKEKEDFLSKQEKHNEAINQFKESFEQGHGDAVEKYIHMVLERSRYPQGLDRQFEVQYEPISETVVIAYELPNPDSIPKVIRYKYVASKKEIEKVEMKKKEFEAFYENVLYQICLRTMHEVFEAVYTECVKSVVFNGWVSGIDRSTGKDFHSCILSCQATRDSFKEYNLERVEPKEAFRSMKGLSAGPLSQLAPVKPILELKRDDKRFVESRDVLAGINSSTNLASIEWAEFEHLVRELFGFLFSKEGGEVRVTQASRDGGVDAIAFDPDPIRGGKFVIQAKRYNNVVPVSAVRDLYGTMISEGATKGILVTTSYYGNDSREFVKDKPISLIDGPNLVYLFNEYGYDVTINLRTKQ